MYLLGGSSCLPRLGTSTALDRLCAGGLHRGNLDDPITRVQGLGFRVRPTMGIQDLMGFPKCWHYWREPSILPRSQNLFIFPQLSFGSFSNERVLTGSLLKNYARNDVKQACIGKSPKQRAKLPKKDSFKTISQRNLGLL